MARMWLAVFPLQAFEGYLHSFLILRLTMRVELIKLMDKIHIVI